MGIFSRRPIATSKVTGTIDRISDMGNDHITFAIILVGDRKLYKVGWNDDGRNGYSLYLAKPGDRVTMIVEDERKNPGIVIAQSIVNHDYA